MNRGHIYAPVNMLSYRSLVELRLLTVWVVIMCLFFSLLNRATPLMAMLLVSVAPEVKRISLGSAPIRSAICWIHVSELENMNRQFKNGPCEPPLLLYPPPSRTRVFDCGDFHIGRLNTEAWHPKLWGRQA